MDNGARLRTPDSGRGIVCAEAGEPLSWRLEHGCSIFEGHCKWCWTFPFPKYSILEKYTALGIGLTSIACRFLAARL